ncbi:MAG: HAMP domain-containing histidine kinase [Anaerolineae bacterium]|nr:HAMP domain-containing histidine kinase [Anaerolineae bacterium]
MRTFLSRLFCRVPILRAVVETALLVLLLSAVYLLARQPDKTNLTSLDLLLGGGSAVWLAFRTKKTSGAWFKRLVVEGFYGLLLILMLLAVGLALVFILDLKDYLWQVWLVNGILSLLSSLFLFGLLRLGQSLWDTWHNMRRKNMALALTHAQLGLVVLLVLAAVLAVVLLGVLDAFLLSRGQTDGLLPLLWRQVDRVVIVSGLIIMLAFPLMAVMLAVLGLFSYLFARRTTRRLNDLAQAAEKLRLSGEPVQVVVEGEDEVARLQTSFNHMSGELTRALHDLQTERDHVTRLLEERRRLFAGVSHELRTPLAILRSAQEHLSADPLLTSVSGPARDVVLIEHQIDRLQTQLDDLFTLARAEVDRLPLHYSEQNLETLTENSVGQFVRRAWETDKVELVYDKQDVPLLVWVDPIRLEQALVNLIRNALRYTSPGGVVLVQTRRFGQEGVISVSDMGCGISAADLPFVWERYYRVPDQGEDGPEVNAGLGLALVKEFVEAMQGHVGVESKPGEGCCFSLYFKLIDSH